MTTNILDRLHISERDQSHPNMRPRDAATLILIDRSGPAPKVLMGRRHARHKFMPGVFVFPGGRLETFDARMPYAGDLSATNSARLMKMVQRPSMARARGLALAALRETAEEVGLLLGQAAERMPKLPSDSWQPFADAKVLPDLAQLHFIARAITPPRRNRRFDARFFAADADAVRHRIDGVVGPDSELDEMVWIPLAEAQTLELSTITQVILEELEQRIAHGFGAALPVPFFRVMHGKFVREVL
ncbi:MAG: NUDIX domain-containing protein [Rhizobiales bacterium]|nr:NUDIX domain-containing protein [Hyphomicrobiales bacterium]